MRRQNLLSIHADHGCELLPEQKVIGVLDSISSRIENILSIDPEINIFLKEILVRPDVHVLQKWGIPAEYRNEVQDFLAYLEHTQTTHLLFYYNMKVLGELAVASEGEKYKFSVNAYPADIEHGDFMNTVINCGFAERLVIEMTEKKEWSLDAISKLMELQENHGVRLAMDDIHPVASQENFAMKTLNICKQNECYMNLGKIDGRFFQSLYLEGNYNGLKQRIISDHISHKIHNFVIEFIETPEQLVFAQKLQKDPEIQKLGLRFGFQGYLFDEKKYQLKK